MSLPFLLNSSWLWELPSCILVFELFHCHFDIASCLSKDTFLLYFGALTHHILNYLLSLHQSYWIALSVLRTSATSIAEPYLYLHPLPLSSITLYVLRHVCFCVSLAQDLHFPVWHWVLMSKTLLLLGSCFTLEWVRNLATNIAASFSLAVSLKELSDLK